MKKILFVFSLLSLFTISNCFAGYCTSKDKNIKFDRYIFDGCNIIQIYFPFGKICSDEITTYLKKNEFKYQLSDTFKKLEKYCSSPDTNIHINIENNFNDFRVDFGRTVPCEPYAQYCDPQRHKLFQSGYIEITKDDKLMKILRKIKRKKPLELFKIINSEIENSIPIGPTSINELLPEEINISLTCEKLDNGEILCSFLEDGKKAREKVVIQAKIKDLNILDQQIKTEQKKTEIQFEQRRKVQKKECPELYRKLYRAQQGYYLDPIVGLKTSQRFDELGCSFWLQSNGGY